MRTDYEKLFRENGKRRSHNKRARRLRPKMRPPRITEDYDNYPHHERMKPSPCWWDDAVETDFKYKLVDRYLKSQVGRKWDDIYSDVCRVSDEKHYFSWRRAIEMQIDRHTIIIDEVVYVRTRWGWIYTSPYMYVHPETGVLTINDNKLPTHMKSIIY